MNPGGVGFRRGVESGHLKMGIGVFLVNIIMMGAMQREGLQATEGYLLNVLGCSTY